MNLKEYCRKAVESVWTPKGLLELKVYLQKLPAPSLVFEKSSTNDGKVFMLHFLCETVVLFSLNTTAC